MKSILLFLLIPTFSWAGSLNSPAPFPIFLKLGFSSVVEFEEVPTRVVIGDGHNFQVEKLDHSLIIKTVVPYATTNLFVYFKEKAPKLFVLTASDEAEPTYFKKFETIKTVPSIPSPNIAPVVKASSCRLISSEFDRKKDYLIVNVEISASSSQAIKPIWNQVQLRYAKQKIIPSKLWSERKDIQRDTHVRARFIFAKPNIPRSLSGVTLLIPVTSGGRSFSVALKRVQS